MLIVFFKTALLRNLQAIAVQSWIKRQKLLKMLFQILILSPKIDYNRALSASPEIAR